MTRPRFDRPPRLSLSGIGILVAVAVVASAALATTALAKPGRPASMRLVGVAGTITADAKGSFKGKISVARVAHGTWPTSDAKGGVVGVGEVCSLDFVGDDLGDDRFHGGSRILSFSLNFEEIRFVGDDLGDDCLKGKGVLSGVGGSGSLDVYIDDIIIGFDGGKTYDFSRGRGLLIPAVQ